MSNDRVEGPAVLLASQRCYSVQAGILRWAGEYCNSARRMNTVLKETKLQASKQTEDSIHLL